MTSLDETKLIARIQKLHAMAESAKEVGSLAEAESFMEAVQKTLTKYNLDASVLAKDVRQAQDPLVKGVSLPTTYHYGDTPNFGAARASWAFDLLEIVAHAHFCSTLQSLKTNAGWIVGRQSNVTTAERMFCYLRDMAIREGERAYQAERRRLWKTEGHTRAKEFLLNWLEGFAVEVGVRYYNMRQRVDSDSGMAVVLVGVRKEASEHANALATAKADAKSNALLGASQYLEDAREQGREAARGVNLRAPLEHNTTDHRKLRA